MGSGNGKMAAVEDARPALRVAYIVRSFPRLSQTHILNEILGLERLGHRILIFGMTRSGEALQQEGVGDLEGPVAYLDEGVRRSLRSSTIDHLKVIRRHPVRYVTTLAFLSRRADLASGYTTTSRSSCFKQAVHLAARLQTAGGRELIVDHVHSHFAHDPTLVALLVARLTGVPYTFTAHARDMLQIPPSSLAERITSAKAVVTICQANIDFMRGVTPETKRSRYELVHTGIDIEAFRPLAGDLRPPQPPLIVTVTRLVEKKGVVDLVHALQRVKADGRSFRCVIYGDGPLKADIQDAISTCGLTEEVELAGAATLTQLREALPRADAFVLTPFVTEDGDRDGIPSAILEAMACGLPVLSTPVGGIAEAVVHGESGLLADPRDVAGIAVHLTTLLDDEELRQRLGRNGREAILRHWSASSVAKQLASVFDDGPGRS